MVTIPLGPSVVLIMSPTAIAATKVVCDDQYHTRYKILAWAESTKRACSPFSSVASGANSRMGRAFPWRIQIVQRWDKIKITHTNEHGASLGGKPQRRPSGCRAALLPPTYLGIARRYEYVMLSWLQPTIDGNIHYLWNGDCMRSDIELTRSGAHEDWVASRCFLNAWRRLSVELSRQIRPQS